MMNEDDVHDQWAERTGAYSPDYYAYYGADETSDLIGALLDRFVDHGAAILELGCSSGRHLDHLRERGYKNLHGVDINDEAFEVMAREYPDLTEVGTFHCAAIEDVVRDADDGDFDVVYSVETLQHVHPDASWVFDELTRIATTLLMTAETDAVAGGGDETGSAGPMADSESEDRDGKESALSEIREVDEMPLYVRDWARVFTERGWIELEDDTQPFDYHTLRAFRSPEE
jgi:SAM-dependent methyltransferase